MKASDSGFVRCGWIFNTEAGSGELCSLRAESFHAAHEIHQNVSQRKWD